MASFRVRKKQGGYCIGVFVTTPPVSSGSVIGRPGIVRDSMEERRDIALLKDKGIGPEEKDKEPGPFCYPVSH